MNSVLILGNNSFIGKSIIANLSKKYNIYHTSRSELDLTKYKQIKECLLNRNYDIVINCCFSGGSYKENNLDTYKDNIRMIQNLLECQDLYKKLIVFGSGIEYQDEINITLLKYKESKVLIDSLVKNNNKVIKLNLWGVTGKLEDPRRFISVCINNCKNNEDIVITEDKYFDFFSDSDLCLVINYLISNLPKDYLKLDCCYKEKYKLSEMALIIKNLLNSSNSIIINDENGQNYIGNSEDLDKLVLKLDGLVSGIQKML